MSKAEVQAASDGDAKPHYEPNAESWGEYPALKGTANEMGHKFEVWYFVDPYDGLYAIRLVPQGWYWCIDIRERSMQRWGYKEPALRRPEPDLAKAEGEQQGLDYRFQWLFGKTGTTGFQQGRSTLT